MCRVSARCAVAYCYTLPDRPKIGKYLGLSWPVRAARLLSPALQRRWLQPVSTLMGYVTRADERDDKVNDPADDAQAEGKAVAAQQTPTAYVERLHKLLVHIWRI